jgi:hypothetical protein
VCALLSCVTKADTTTNKPFLNDVENDVEKVTINITTDGRLSSLGCILGKSIVLRTVNLRRFLK